MSEHEQVWQDIFNEFNCPGVVASVTPYGSGHINDTFLVVTQGDAHCNYTFRCVNTDVFKNIDGLMHNIALVTSHITQKLKTIADSCTSHSMHLVMTKTNKPYFRDDSGHIWTCYHFVPGQSHEHFKNETLAHQAGLAYGQFIALMQDMDAEQLCETIPDFHDIDLRLGQWHEACAQATEEDLATCAPWVAFVQEREEQMHFLKQLKTSGALPLRITHNDTKCNNVLFDDQDHATCVIDLDTVMPGLIHFDFSDAIRTATTAHDEDEKDITRIQLNFKALEHFCRGYIGQIRHFATEAELSTLAASIPYIPYLLGVRFFTDHLSGDTYFKTQYRGHNLVRARNQFRFIQILEREEANIVALIDSICKQTAACA